MNDNKSDKAKDAGNLMHVPDGAVCRAEVTLYDDGSINVLTHPSEESGAALLDVAIDMLKDECDGVDITSVHTPGIVSTDVAEA